MENSIYINTWCQMEKHYENICSMNFLMWKKNMLEFCHVVGNATGGSHAAQKPLSFNLKSQEKLKIGFHWAGSSSIPGKFHLLWFFETSKKLSDESFKIKNE